MIDAYDLDLKAWIEIYDGLLPLDILKSHNEHFDDLEINQK
jgi:hypothetical protein